MELLKDHNYSCAELENAFGCQLQSNDLALVLKDKAAFTLDVFAHCEHGMTCKLRVGVSPSHNQKFIFQAEAKIFTRTIRALENTHSRGKISLVIQDFNLSEAELRDSRISVEDLYVTDRVAETTRKIRLSMGEI
jgi:hypothetical protein